MIEVTDDDFHPRRRQTSQVPEVTQDKTGGSEPRLSRELASVLVWELELPFWVSWALGLVRQPFDGGSGAVKGISPCLFSYRE